MRAATTIRISHALEQEIRNAALLPIKDDDLERLELERGVNASQLKIDLSHAYRPVVNQIVYEVVSYDIIMTGHG